MSPDFRLRFDQSEIRHWASRYMESMKEDERVLEGRVACKYGPDAKARGHLEKDEFLQICLWKTKRTRRLCVKNRVQRIRTISTQALSAADERSRITRLIDLHGVGWPTASVILHFCAKDRYPILDFRALWSLSLDVPKSYSFDFWWRYTEFTRRFADQAQVSMRELDRALWQYSKEHQKAAALA